MKTLEYNHGGNWFDRLNNALAVDQLAMRSWAIAWDAEGIYCPQDYSLYYNGFVFLRFTFPFGVFLHLKPLRDARLQIGCGWKLNGRLGLIARWQTDAKAAQGAHENAPNVGQATGWNRGTA